MGVIPQLIEPTVTGTTLSVHVARMPNANDGFYRFLAPANFSSPAELDPGYSPDSRIPLLRGFALAPLAIAALAIGLRIYSRLRILKRLGWDDWAIIPALMAYMAYTGLIIWGTKSAGLGDHLYNLDAEHILNWFKVQYLLVIVAPITFLLIRFSILLFLRRLAGQSEPGAQVAIKILHVLNFLWYPASVLPPVLMCAPRELRMWDLTAVMRAHCLEPGVADRMQINSTVMVILSAVFDISCLLIPVRLVWKLNMSTNKKLVVSSLFGVGILACVAGILRAYFMAKLLEKSETSFDSTWNIVNPLICAHMEACLGIITACGPSLKMLCKNLFDSGASARELPMGKRPNTWMSSSTEGNRGWSDRVGPGPDCSWIPWTRRS